MDWREYQQLQRVAEIGDRFVSYVDQGTGEPIVLIHGIPTWGYLWDGLLEPLARTHRVLVPDLLGFGYSDKSDRFDRSISTQAVFIEAWMDKLRVRRAAIFGHDIGGGIAQRLAVFSPQRVTRMCLANTVCYDIWPIEAMVQAGQPELYRQLSADALVTLIRQQFKGALSTADASALDGLLAPYTTDVGKLSLIRNASALNTNLTAELTPLLPRIKAPTLILWGEDDRYLPIRYGERLAWDIPTAELIRIAGASHLVMIDKPVEVAGHVASFLSSATVRRAA